MKKIAVLSVVVMMLVVMVAGIAEAKGRPAGAGQGHKKDPVVTYVFKGDVAAVNGDSVVVNVVRGNKFARAYFGQPVEFTVGDSTRIVKDDSPATLSDLAPGDEVVVRSRAPKSGAQSFTARMIVSRSSAAQ